MNSTNEDKAAEWHVDVAPGTTLPHADTIITLRTHEIIVERKGKLYTILNNVNKGLLIVSSMLLFSVSILSIVFAVTLLNNLHILEVMKSQVVPGQ